MLFSEEVHSGESGLRSLISLAFYLILWDHLPPVPTTMRPSAMRHSQELSRRRSHALESPTVSELNKSLYGNGKKWTNITCKDCLCPAHTQGILPGSEVGNLKV